MCGVLFVCELGGATSYVCGATWGYLVFKGGISRYIYIIILGRFQTDNTQQVLTYRTMWNDERIQDTHTEHTLHKHRHRS